jgi:hypothetical protein
MTARRLAFSLLFAATLAVYVTMLAWTLPAISAAAGGLAPFDLRPSGYTFDEAKAFLTALSPDGKALYLGAQHRLDAAYPALLSATLFFAIAALTPTAWGSWRWVLALTAIPGALFDYLENAAVTVMLTAGADDLTPDMVATADRWTTSKSWSSTVAMTILLALLVAWGWRAVAARLRGHAS